MRMTKLTLSANRVLIEEAKKLAAQQGTSRSSMFARFLRAVLRGRQTKEKPGPLTARAKGLVKLPARKSDRELLEDALGEKYGLKR
jgi:hypothetical protein